MKQKLARQRGLPIPEDETPEEQPLEDIDFLPDHLLWIWDAFAILSRTRLVNQTGPQPITLLELDTYCSLEGIWEEDERRTLLHHITLLDIEWLKVSHSNIAKAREEEKQKAERESKKANKGRR
jgi:hypothetical protein